MLPFPAQRRWFQLLTSALPEEGDYGAVFMHIDISERVPAIAGTAETNSRLERLIQQATVGIVVLDTEFRFIIANNELAKIFGYPGSETILGLCDFRSLFRKDDRAGSTR